MYFESEMVEDLLRSYGKYLWWFSQRWLLNSAETQACSTDNVSGLSWLSLEPETQSRYKNMSVLVGKYKWLGKLLGRVFYTSHLCNLCNHEYVTSPLSIQMDAQILKDLFIICFVFIVV